MLRKCARYSATVLLGVQSSPTSPDCSLADYKAAQESRQRLKLHTGALTTPMCREMREYYIPDFTAWKDHDAFEAAVDRLLRDLKAAARPPAGARPAGSHSPRYPKSNMVGSVSSWWMSPACGPHRS
jgi:hypothetical protein